MKILVISRLFAPDQRIGAVRWTKLCKYLSAEGFAIDILCDRHTGKTDPLLLRDLPHCGRILRVGSTDELGDAAAFSVQAQSAAASLPAKPLPTGIKKAIINSLPFRKYQELSSARKYLRSEKQFADNALARLTASRDVSEYDCIIATFGPLGNVLTALELKRRFPNVPLIADFRDPMVTTITHKVLHPLYTKYQKAFCDAAERILAVSQGYAQSVCSCEAHTQKCIVLRNGFDPQDTVQTAAAQSDDRFTFCCTGSLYRGKRDMSPLFDALRRLAEQGDIDRGRVVVKYAGNDIAALYEQADAYGVRDMVEALGVLGREDAIDLQTSSQALLLPNWNFSTEKGVLPGKFYEYAQAGVPVILLTSGDCSGSELRSLMDKARLGLSYEEASADTDMPLLCEYIKRQYDRFVAGEPLEYAPDSDVLARFEYGNIAKRAADIIREVVGDRK